MLLARETPFSDMHASTMVDTLSGAISTWDKMACATRRDRREESATASFFDEACLEEAVSEIICAKVGASKATGRAMIYKTHKRGGQDMRSSTC